MAKAKNSHRRTDTKIDLLAQRIKENTGLDFNDGEWHNRLLVATPSTGTIRMEWALARYGQVIPTNWSHVDVLQWINPYVPVRYLLVDAENLIAKTVVEGNFEWLLFIEEDNVIPPDAFIRINQYMQECTVPVVSGLYFTKSVPPEPILYRGRGNGAFHDWKFGDKVWVDGIPFGFTLIHGSIIRALWEISEPYKTSNGQETRKVFRIPGDVYGNPEDGAFATTHGTSDLDFCTRLTTDRIWEKAGWPEYQSKKNPFLVDTNIFVKHIDLQGRQYPIGGIPERYFHKKGKPERQSKKFKKTGK
jgi:hypothetical protein